MNKLDYIETYEDALRKVDILKRQKYAFSTDNETTAKTKANSLKKQYKMQGPPKKDKSKRLWEVPALEECHSDDKCIILFYNY